MIGVLPMLACADDIKIPEQITPEYVKALIKEIRHFKRRVDNLERMEKSNSARLQDQRIELNELSDYAERTETKVLRDKINFGVNYDLSVDNFDNRYTDGHSQNHNGIVSNKLTFNVQSDITKNLKFHGRLSMYKYWGSGLVHPYSYYDNMQGRVPEDSGLYEERAYFDWYFNRDGKIPVALTIRRQPSSDGPSTQLKLDLRRKGTYSALLYDGAGDGVVATFNVQKIVPLPKARVRIGYAKGYGDTETLPDVGNAYVGPSNSDIEDTNVLGLFVESALPDYPDSLVQLSCTRMFDIVANPLDPDKECNVNIGDVELFGGMVEADGLADGHLDLFAHVGYSYTHPNGKRYAAYGTLPGRPGESRSHGGHAFWLGGRYGSGRNDRYKVAWSTTTAVVIGSASPRALSIFTTSWRPGVMPGRHTFSTVTTAI